MGLIFCDSCDHYLGPTPKWNNVGAGGTVNTNTVLYPGRNARCRPAGYGSDLKALPGEFNTLCAGAAWKCDVFNALAPNIFAFRNVAAPGSPQVHLGAGYRTDGLLYLISARQNSTRTSAVSTIAVSEKEWYYIEVSATNAGNVVISTLYLNEEPVCTLVGTHAASDTWVNGWSNLTVYFPGTFDDIYVNDDGTPYGDVDVICLRPNGTTSLSQWTPVTTATGTPQNWQMVDDDYANTTAGQSDYVLATTTGLVDLYEMEDIAPFVGEIRGVQGLLYAKKLDAGAGRARQVYVIDSLGTWTSPEHYFSAYDYHFYTLPLATNPLTGTTWLADEVNDLKLGIMRSM